MNELSMNGLLGSRWKYVDSRPSRGYGNTLLLDGKGFFPALKQSVRMRLSTAVALALTVLLAVSAIGSVVVPAAASSSADSESPALPSSHPSSDAFAAAVQGNTTNYEPEPADTWQEIRLNVTDDGDVRWTIESRFVLSDSETDQFEAYATDIANGDRETRGYDVEQYEQALEQAERSTGREMAYEDASWNEPRYESLRPRKALTENWGSSRTHLRGRTSP